MRRFLFFGAVLGLLVPSFAFANTNLVVNGGFETGDFTGWTQFGNTGFTGVTGNFEGVSPEEGIYQAYFGGVGSTGGISQTLTSSSANYTVSFWLYNFGGTPSSATVSLGLGPTLLSLPNPPAFGYTEHTFTNVNAGADPVLTFTFRQDPSYFLLDNVSVVASTTTPEPGFYWLLALGLSGLAVVGRRRKACNSAGCRG
jgi:hypothetical protein